MGTIPPFSREAVLSVFASPLYDTAAALELIMMIGPPDDASIKAESFAHELNELAKSFAFNLWNEVQASTPEREKQSKRLADACQKVLEIVGVADGGELLPMFGSGGLFAAANIRGEARGEAATRNGLRAVELLRLDALQMREVEGKRRRMKGVRAGRPENVAMQRLVRELSCMYEGAWGRAPGVSTGAAVEPSGPLMRLMLHVTGRIKERGLRFGNTAAALRGVWQRLDAGDKMPLTILAEQSTAIDRKAREPCQNRIF